ncbi:hypothetical protein [Methylobacterium platani]|uniref:Uncharacterized protein n=2 Tax=Methylobacterium platani TaxID=427683 RepID=A0A179S599_9HYPH|nr:hypothetical protein [Methylobacterium platani]KMO13944.1 hypothetical protein SQ03_20805 [Methylobacterium platani JCM 14648]OAS20064.1 hypothetical protein A5481_23440 [Methylobacterium platani]
MTDDRAPDPKPGEGLADDSLGASRRPAGAGGTAPATGTPQGGRPADDQVPREAPPQQEP